jgi:hypothetical protein
LYIVTLDAVSYLTAIYFRKIAMKAVIALIVRIR